MSFVNTHAGGRGEQLEDAHTLRQWLRAVGHPDDAVSDADAATAREFRDALQTLLLAHSQKEAAPPECVARAEARIARIADGAPLRAVTTRFATTLVPVREGVWGAFGAILAAVAELDRAGMWQRIKACRNEVCHEGFLDRSRNASALYHGPGCASMVSMRAYRQRKKGSQ
ncbi:CGNR zinc finger domain-containing protein [Streptomyces sp. NPDC046870]|uniref:CGNR zinc finger domain-containing protein n=1 Tax=Streptomyces sp. NPDC046870 TaxID=3155135 RepID=UPI00345335FB